LVQRSELSQSEITEVAMTNFYDLTLTKLKAFLIENGIQKFRAEQMFRWVYGQKITDISQMINISKVDREKLGHLLKFELPKTVLHRQSKDGTEKFLFDVGGGQTIESVLIPAGERMTLCVSSEIGCNMACQFCYTGKQKLKRRLTVSEIVGQFLGAQESLTKTSKPGSNARVTNIVFMGMGEPLDNPEAVFDSIDVIHDPLAGNLSLKKITVSTSGIVPMIPLVTKSKTRLAVSLNGADDEVRTKIMPINKRWPIDVLLDACRLHADETGDSITFEYVLLKDVTDSIEDARKLYKLTRSIPCKINIIPFNEHPGSGFHRPSEERIVSFQNELIKLGAHVLRRKTMGRDIYAACGQLTSAFKGKPETLTAGV
jgi:23S rRNA (adenine2503-C2)-methyltransferase